MARDYNALRVKALEQEVMAGEAGINWDWYFFPTERQAIAFDDWCIANGFETRGVYSPFGTYKGWGVRYR